MNVRECEDRLKETVEDAAPNSNRVLAVAALLLSRRLEEMTEQVEVVNRNLDRMFEYLPFVGRGV